MDKNKKRQRRYYKIRGKIKQQGKIRLSVKRTSRHIIAQLTAVDGKVIASASSLEAKLRTEATYTGNVQAAKMVGKLVAERALEAGVSNIAFDRSGYKYHGRILALAEAAREAGLVF